MKFILFISLFLSSGLAWGQVISTTKAGNVSFITSSNVYVKFSGTESILVGDTLLMGASPCLVVSNKSSSSVVCVRIGDCAINKGDSVVFQSFEYVNNPKLENANLDTIIKKESIVKRFTEKVDGRISVSSNSNISSIRDNSHRIMYRGSFRATNIGGSKFSFETNFNYNQYFNQSDSGITRKRDFLNVYNLALRYDVDSSLSITVGRKINRKMTSIGSTDGLHVEKTFGNVYSGIIVGFRPDVFDFSFNPNRFQYGGYVGFLTRNKTYYSQTTLGFVEHYHTGRLDRRYGYLQHSGRLGRKLTLYSSAELDLYSTSDTLLTSYPRLTNLYVSANYKVNQKIRVNVSYGARKRIIFHESYPSLIQEIIEQDETRHGAKIGTHIRPTKNIGVGASYSTRFQKNSENKSNNINAYFSYSKLPIIGGRLRINYNFNSSNYFGTNVISIRHSRHFLKQKLVADFYYRYLNYNYTNINLNRKQSYLGTNLSYRLTRKLLISALGEVAVLSNENSFRLNFKIIQRF